MEKSDKSRTEINNEYEILKQKYNLPEFNLLAEDFDIEKIIEKESSFLLREIRKMAVEKISSYLHLLENLINPNSPPMFIFTILKNAEEEDRDLMKELYKKMAKLQIEAIKLDTIYNEENEAKFIIRTAKEWESAKQKSYDLFKRFEDKLEESTNPKNKGYFG